MNNNIQGEIDQNIFPAMFEEFPFPLVLTDTEGFIKLINGKFHELLDFSFNELVNKSLSILFVNNTFEYSIIEENIKACNHWTGEISNKNKNGEIHWDNVVLSPIGNKEKIITNFLVIIEDITLRKFKENKLEESKNISDESNRLKSAFLANISHELRTPINGILGFSEMLSDDCSDDERLVYQKTIHSSALRLSELINDLLSFSRIESGQLEVNNVEFNIIDLLKSLKQQYEIAANSKNLYIELVSHANEIFVELDPKLLSSCISNLLNNAINYTNIGGIKIVIIETRDTGERKVVIDVEDTGNGISQERLNIIFEEFRQMDMGMPRIFEDSGMGFKITKEYVEKMGGTINVESELGKGSKFTIILPAKVKSTI